VYGDAVIGEGDEYVGFLDDGKLLNGFAGELFFFPKQINLSRFLG